jgi:2-dehydro-3-deoxy-D-arabinonate dehydratase
MKLYRTTSDCIIEQNGSFYSAGNASWDSLVVRENLEEYLNGSISNFSKRPHSPLDDSKSLLAPIGSQEVWAAGVTYFRSRDARMEESKSAGGGDFYDRVYGAERPELFFKATPHRVAGPAQTVAIRSDSKWNVPEPELTLLISPGGKIQGYTIGNDMSSRDIEGENPLYLPQAKVYHRSCAIGPCVLVSSKPLSLATTIKLEIRRSGQTVFEGKTSLENLKRDPQSLVEFLYRDNSFPSGAYLLTGTGIVPPDNFTLNHSDEISISIDAIGTLTNSVV